jgi:2-oxoglutarate dehydrogenase E2 component (dihydrolipoamide succinyltransferase)
VTAIKPTDMNIEIKVPSPGESITEVEIAQWLKSDGDYVEKDEEIAEIDSDKATLTIAAEESGKLKILAQEGDTVEVDSVICMIDTDAEAPAGNVKKEKENEKEKDGDTSVQTEKPGTQSAGAGSETGYATCTPSPAAAKLMKEKGLQAEAIKGSGKDGRIIKEDVLTASGNGNGAAPAPVRQSGSREVSREKMSMLRRKLSKRLVSVKNETAMLTTFNEVDMSPIMNIRKQHKEKFKEVHGVGLGFMSFFTKAVCEALLEFPAVNAMIDGDEMVKHDYCDIGIAVSAPKGLMVPVIRNAESLSLAQIESEVLRLAKKARDGKIGLDEMEGGTFTITNGGVFGSMLSTPIINPPQSAILGMHNIVERPIAVNGKVEIRPVMYVALSYDHRIIDGRESVSFLVKVKQMLENPVQMLHHGKDPVNVLLGL